MIRKAWSILLSFWKRNCFAKKCEYQVIAVDMIYNYN